MADLIKRLQNALEDQLWVRPALWSLMSLAVVAVAAVFDEVRWLAELPFNMTEKALADLFSIIASSMLTVATFSVAAIVTAISAVSSTTTPRAERLVLADSTAQNVLASFVTAFIYSMIGLLALEAYPFGPAGRLILFVALVSIVAWVLLSFLGWVSHVTSLGRVSSTIARIESYALGSADVSCSGGLGGRLYDGHPPAGLEAMTVRSDDVGYITIVSVQQLERLAGTIGCNVYLGVRPGDFIRRGSLLATLAPLSQREDEVADSVRSALVVGTARQSTQDIRFGLGMLTETADRALSPGINDPMTGVAILHSQLRVLTTWVVDHKCGEGDDSDGGLPAPHVFVPRIDRASLILDTFTPIARDGAGQVEVAKVLQETMAAIVDLREPGLSDAAVAMARRASVYAGAALVVDEDKALIGDLAERLAARPSGERFAPAEAGRREKGHV